MTKGNYMKRRRKKRVSEAEGRRRYDTYMRNQKGLPNPEWEIVDPHRSRVIPIFRWIYEKNQEHIRKLTTSRGARFRIKDLPGRRVWLKERPSNPI